MDFYEANRDDRYEIVAFHDASVKDFEEFDRQAERYRRDHWKGRRLPFPVLLDATGQTLATWQVRAFPTLVLLDPEGRIVERGDGCLDTLKRQLAD